MPVKTDAEAKKARQELAKIQEEWDQIGYVPRDDMRRIENRLDAVDKQIKPSRMPLGSRPIRSRRPQVQLRGAAQRPARRARRQDRGRIRPEEEAKLEAEKATKEQWLNAIK